MSGWKRFEDEMPNRNGWIWVNVHWKDEKGKDHTDIDMAYFHRYADGKSFVVNTYNTDLDELEFYNALENMGERLTGWMPIGKPEVE